MEEKMIKPGVDEIVEHFNVSGVLHVTIDNDSVHTLMFNQHVRIHIAFNNEKQNKELNPLPFVKSESPDIVELIESGEEDVGVDEEMFRSDGICESNAKLSTLSLPVASVIFNDSDALSEEINLIEANSGRKRGVCTLDRDSQRNIQIMPQPSPDADNSVVSCAKNGPTRSEDVNPNPLQSFEGTSGGTSPKKVKLNKIRNKMVVSLHNKTKKSSTKNSGVSLELNNAAKFKSSKETSLHIQEMKMHRKQSSIILSQGSVTESTSKSRDRLLKKVSSLSEKMQSSIQDPEQSSHDNDNDHAANDFQSKKHGTQETISCAYCSQDFDNIAALQSHHTVIGSDQFSCNFCFQVFNKKAYLLTHEALYHTEVEEDSKGTKSYVCKECGESLYSKKVRPHMLTHTGEMQFKCCICSFQTSSLYCRFKHHLKMHERTLKFECKSCHIFFHTRGELMNHQITHKFECDLCGEAFSSKTGRNFHYKTAHSHTILKCLTCGRMYSSVKALAAHHKQHRRKQQQCSVCGRSFTYLKKHMQAVHPDEPSLFMCDKCPKEFKSKKSLARHVNVHHLNGPGDNQRLYSCDICDKQYPTSRSLKRHLMAHTGEKPYVCNICGKACSQPGNLKIHMRVHFKYPPVNCLAAKESVDCKDEFSGCISNAETEMSISYVPKL